MEVSTNGSSFGIESILSHRPNSPCRSPAELSTRSDMESDCSSPPSPRRSSVDDTVQRHARTLGLDSPLQISQQPRTVTSSFFIRDILADCKPLATCAPYSSNGQPAQDAEDCMDKLHSNSSSESEFKGETFALCGFFLYILHIQKNEGGNGLFYSVFVRLHMLHVIIIITVNCA